MKVFTPKLLSDLKHYNRETFVKDAIAGLIVGIVALPLAIAFGIASGVTPEKGIITAIVAGFLISALGGSKVQIGGPTGAFIVIIAGIISQYGLTGLAIATFMAGIFLILLGVLRMGTIIKYIPYPIVVGFTSGIAVTIFSTQIKDLFGLKMSTVPSDFIEKWIAYFKDMHTIDAATAAIGIASVVVIAMTPKILGKASKFIPGSLVAIVIMTVVALLLKHYAGIDSIETIGDRFAINNHLPDMNVPDMSWGVMKGLITPAVTIAILGAIESLLSATVADGVIGDRHDSNMELIGQGVANMVSPIFGGIPATGAIARTMTNISNGGRTPIAGLIHAVVLLLIFLFAMPLANYIPMACLAGVLVIVSYNMSGWRTFKQMMKNPKSDITVLVVTFLLTVIFDLTIAIEIGLVVACVMLIKRIADNTDISVIMNEIDTENDGDVLHHDEEHLIIPNGVEVYEINGPFFFGAGNKFEDLMAEFEEAPKVRIIRMRKVPFIDSTGIHNLQNMVEMSHRDNITVILSGVNEKVKTVLLKNNFEALVGANNICSHINIALERANEIIDED